MEKLEFNIIDLDRDIDSFIDKIQSFTGVRLPKIYAKNSKIVGAFLHENLVGGYMLVTKPQFRSLLFVPDEIKKTHSFFKNDTYEMLEVNGVWLGSAIKTPKMQFQFWMKLLMDVFLQKKKYLLLMSNLKNKNIGYLHSLASPEILYEGTPNLAIGDISHELIRVGYTTRFKAIMNIPKYWMELLDRERRARAFIRQRKLARSNPFRIDPNVAQ